MNYIIISPYFPQNFQKFAIELHKAGVNVLGIGQESYEQLDAPLKAALTEYYRVQNLEDVTEVKRAVAYLFYKHGAIDRIESQNEHWLTLDAQLREQFNVFGIKEADLKKTKYKSEMKKCFIKAGVPIAAGRLVTSRAEIAEAVAALGLPLIAKPDSGVGAAATYKLSSQEDVAHFATSWDEQHPYFLEQFITDGVITTYDGILDREGNIVYECGMTYYHTPLDLLTNPDLDCGYYIEKDLDPQLVAYGRAAIKAFGMRERFFHIEFFKRSDGSYIAIEYNNRPAGTYSLDVYNYTHAQDQFAVYAKVVMGTLQTPVVKAHRYGLATTRRACNTYRYSDAELRSRYGDAFKAALRLPEVFAALQGDVMYIYAADTFEEITTMREETSLK